VKNINGLDIILLPGWRPIEPRSFPRFCLEAAFHRGLHKFLVLRTAHAHEEKIGIATNVLDGRKRDCVHPLFDDGVPGSRKSSDPMSQSSHEVLELIGR
jgi:hypothetical protein